MSRRKIIAAIAALIGVASIAIAALALTRAPSAAEATSRVTDAPGRHGGTVLKDGDLSLEVVLPEKERDARLIVYPYLSEKQAGQGISVSATIRRFDGSTHSLQFAYADGRLVSNQAVSRPHVFDATFNAKWQGKSSSWTFSRSDSIVTLSPEQVQAAGIGLAQAGPSDIAAALQLPGEIKFNEDHTAHVVPRVAGIVERVAVSVGENVGKGQLLAVISSADLAERRSELLSAERRFAAARTSYQREKALWEERISAEQDFQQAQVQLREMEIAVQNARQKLAALNAPANADELNRYELRAPFAGTIVEKHLSAGEAVTADANIFTLSDLSSVWAEMAVPAQQLNQVSVGRSATVCAAAFDSKAIGRIAYVGSLLGEQTRTAPARVVLTNPGGVWRPGMFVNVSVDAGQRQASVAVLSEAIQSVGGASVVFVDSPKGFVPQVIETGRRDEHMVEVLRGIRPGQRYAAANSFTLKAELEKGSAEAD